MTTNESGTKKKRARFPARGSIVTRKYPVDEIKRGDDESDEDFATRQAWVDAMACAEIGVKLLSRDQIIELRHAKTVWAVAEEKRKAEAEAKGERVLAFTAEGALGLREWCRRVVVATIHSLKNIDFGETPSEEMTGERLADAIDGIGLLADFAKIGLDAQDPTPQQLEH